jgi:phosphate transport system substrate-binding protein
LAAGPTVRVNGSTTVNPVVSEAAEALRAEAGLQITVDTQGGSSGGIAALGEGRVEVAMSSKPLAEDDRARYPGVAFHPTRIGSDAVALAVSRDVWEGGVRALTRNQVQALYEGRVRNWKEVGGPDQRVAFFNKEPGRGTWEVFAHWLYGDAKKAPLVSHPEVGANEEARSKVGGSRGAISQLSASWADGVKVFALGIRGDDGAVTLPSAAAIASGAYPLARPLFVITDGAPAGNVKTLVDFLLGARGQALVGKHGYLTLGELGGTAAAGDR